MIKIKNGDTSLTVSQASYDKIFKAQGWKVDTSFEDESKKPVEDDVEDDGKEDDVEDDEDENSDTPLSEYTIAQLRDIAQNEDVDLTGLSRHAEIAAAIQAARDEE